MTADAGSGARSYRPPVSRALCQSGDSGHPRSLSRLSAEHIVSPCQSSKRGRGRRSSASRVRPQHGALRSPRLDRPLCSSARRSLDKLADLFLDGGAEPLQGKGGGPDVTVVEVGRILETERRVSRFELLRALEEADNLAVLGICGHPVPGFRREGRRAGFDHGMEPLGHAAIWFRHLGDLREYVAFPVRLTRERARSLFEGLLHGGSFFV